MKKIMLLALIVTGIFISSSCKVCRTCECWKDGKVVEQENCSYGFPPSKRELDTWERYLIEKMGYDSLTCVTN